MFETPSNFRKKIDLYMSNSQFKNDLVEDLGVRSFSSTNMNRPQSATVKSFNNSKLFYNF
jgi:hypothetical protein